MTTSSVPTTASASLLPSARRLANKWYAAQATAIISGYFDPNSYDEGKTELTIQRLSDLLDRTPVMLAQYWMVLEDTPDIDEGWGPQDYLDHLAEKYDGARA